MTVSCIRIFCFWGGSDEISLGTWQLQMRQQKRNMSKQERQKRLLDARAFKVMRTLIVPQLCVRLFGGVECGRQEKQGTLAGLTSLACALNSCLLKF